MSELARTGGRRAAILHSAWILGLGCFALALVVRLIGIGHGLPWVYDIDEAEHFVPVAVHYLRDGTLNPSYFDNPPGLSEVLDVVFRLRFHTGFPFGHSGFALRFATHPQEMFLVAREVVAVLAAAGVGFVALLGRRVGGSAVGVVAGVLLALAPIPVLYGQLALNDAVTVAPVALALFLGLRILERGDRLSWALAGASVGIAAGIKYTGALVVLPLAIVAINRVVVARDGLGTVLRRAGLAVTLAVFFFLILNPYAVVHVDAFLQGLKRQSTETTGLQKIGARNAPGIVTGLWTLTWGFGWVPLVAAGGGLLLLARRHRWQAAMLGSLPLIMLALDAGSSEVYARYQLPAYPVFAVLAAYGGVAAARALVRGPRLRWAALALAGAALVVQGALTTLHAERALARTDTRELARRWLLAHVPAGTSMEVEPVFPTGWLTDPPPVGPPRFIVSGSVGSTLRPFYERVLSPSLVDIYRRDGICTIVVASQERDRGLDDHLPGPTAYYARLDAESTLLALFSPWHRDSHPKFDFDQSYLPVRSDTVRGGPEIEIRRLGDCTPAPPPAPGHPAAPVPAPGSPAFGAPIVTPG